jgi:hypothetical protein
MNEQEEFDLQCKYNILHKAIMKFHQFHTKNDYDSLNRLIRSMTLYSVAHSHGFKEDNDMDEEDLDKIKKVVLLDLSKV